MSVSAHQARWQDQTVERDGHTYDADLFLLLYADRLPIRLIADALGRTESAVYTRLRLLGVARLQIRWHEPVIVVGGEQITPHAWLEREYPAGDLEEIAETLCTTINHLYIYAHRQGWRRER